MGDGRKEGREEGGGGEGHKIIMKPRPRTTVCEDLDGGGDGGCREEERAFGGDPIPTREYEIEREKGGGWV